MKKNIAVLFMLVTVLLVSCSKKVVDPVVSLSITYQGSGGDQQFTVPVTGSTAPIQFGTIFVQAQGYSMLLQQLLITVSGNNGYHPRDVARRFYLYDQNGKLVRQVEALADATGKVTILFPPGDGIIVPTSGTTLTVKADVIARPAIAATFLQLFITPANAESIIAYYGEGSRLKSAQISVSYIGPKIFLS